METGLRGVVANYRLQMTGIDKAFPGVKALDGAEFTLAIKPAMRLCEQAPTFSEAFHQLAIAHHGLDDFENADRAYRACLWHCRYHYMAWAGMSECRRVAGDNRRALKMLRRAISISPDFEAARIAARSLNDEIQRMDETSDDR